mmetsp:Transcript_114953/g.199273  ORF Transcript_114953/g.199273 Transcript_114953/m.199273 type:complete len:948 (+) Transcript_114953:63-2906(+)
MKSQEGRVLQYALVGCLLKTCSSEYANAKAEIGDCTAEDEVSQIIPPVSLLQMSLDVHLGDTVNPAPNGISYVDPRSHKRFHDIDWFPPLVTLVVLLCLSVLSCMVSAWSEHHVDAKWSPRLSRGPSASKKTEPGWYLKSFLMHRNKEFGQRSEHAFRGACVFGVYALPFFLPAHILPVGLQKFIDSGVYSSFIGQQILFNYQRTVGETVISALQTTAGTLLAFLTIFTLFGFFPTGVAFDTTGHVYTVGILSGVSLVLCMLWLNFPVKVTIFCLARFSEYWMSFLDPDPAAAAKYSVGFQINYEGTAMKAFLATVVGGFLALTANLLPYPELSLSKAEEDCCETISLLKDGWLTFSGFMMQERKREVMLNKMQRELFLTANRIDDCNKHIANSWWECFGFNVRHRRRALIAELNQANRDMHLLLLGAVQCVMMDDTFAAHHMRFMNQVQDIDALITSAAETVYWTAKSVHVTHTGELLRCVRDTRSKIDSVTKAFHAAKADVGIPQVDDDYLEEHAFCRSLCIYGRMSCDIATLFLENAEGKRDPQMASSIYNGPSILSVFSLTEITSWNNMKLATRFSISYALVFIAGYCGLHDLFWPLTFTLPVTFALLISKEGGVHFKKNLMRLEGVVLGTAVGTLIHVFVAVCSMRNCILSVTIIAFWVWTMLIGHFSGEEHAYLCFLLALFGQNQIASRCSLDDFDTASINLTQDVFAVVTTIIIMTGVDLVFPDRPSSHQAVEALDDTWSTMTDAFKRFFDAETPLRVYDAEAQISGAISKARSLEKAAQEEPRFWKTPWRHESYKKCLASLRLLRACLHTIAKTRPREGLQEYPADKVYNATLKLPEMQALVKLVAEEMDFQNDLIQIFLHEETTNIPQLDLAIEQKVGGEMRTLARSLAEKACLQAMDPDPSQSLEFDSAARISHIIACCYSMGKAMTHLKSTAVLNG